jgi:gamma-butyrobetaine dioxygenase
LDESDNVVLVWSDGHTSTFPPNWLEERSFEPDDVSQRCTLERKPRLLWGSYFGRSFPKADYGKLFSDEQALLDFLEDLECYGFVSIENVPVEKGHLRRLIDHIGFPRRTHYG